MGSTRTGAGRAVGGQRVRSPEKHLRCPDRETFGLCPPPRTERYDPVKPFGPCGAPPPLPPDGETPRTGRRGLSDRGRPQADPGTGMGMGMGDRRGPERRAPPRGSLRPDARF